MNIIIKKRKKKKNLAVKYINKNTQIVILRMRYIKAIDMCVCKNLPKLTLLKNEGI